MSNLFSIRFPALLSLALAGMTSVACGSDDSAADDGSTDDDTVEVDAAPVADLTCGSFAFCNTVDYKTFVDDVPASTGGTIADGVYVLSWSIEEPIANTEPGYHDTLEAMVIAGGQFMSTDYPGSHGQIIVDGPSVTFDSAIDCANVDEEGEPSTRSVTWGFTATPDRLDLVGVGTAFGNGGSVDYRYQLSYVRVDAIADVCALVDQEPTTPGPSAMCTVINCGCKVATDESLDYESCDFNL